MLAVRGAVASELLFLRWLVGLGVDGGRRGRPCLGEEVGEAGGEVPAEAGPAPVVDFGVHGELFAGDVPVVG
jgi:hypothetical protein